MQFEVKSGLNIYTVNIGDQSTLPSCECLQYRKNHLPCKHFVAVFRHTDATFESLPENYKNNPVFTIDEECLDFDLSQVLHNSLTNPE